MLQIIGCREESMREGQGFPTPPPAVSVCSSSPWSLPVGREVLNRSVTGSFHRRAAPPYLALAEPLRALWTACTMASRSMPKIRSSSWGLPLRGTWETARRCTVKPVSFTTAEHTASPRPPGGAEREAVRASRISPQIWPQLLGHFT